MPLEPDHQFDSDGDCIDCAHCGRCGEPITYDESPGYCQICIQQLAAARKAQLNAS